MIAMRPQPFELKAELQERARKTAFEIGERLLAQEPPEGEEDEEAWHRSRDLTGSAGFALAFLALYRASGDARYAAAMHRQLRAAAQVEDYPYVGLFSGISGLRAVAKLATAVEPRYLSLVEKCDAFVERELPLQPGKPETYSAYDIISGWSGARLARCVDGPRQSDRLVELLAWVLHDESRWCCTHPVRTGDPPENDLGMAHGVAGILAALALTVERIEGQLLDTVYRAAHALAARGLQSGGAPVWPHCAQSSDEHYRAVWCYGSPGVCAALSAIALRIDDAQLTEFASQTLLRVAAQPMAQWRMGDQGLCHGTAGNALIFASVASAHNLPELFATAAQLVEKTLDDLDAHGGKCFSMGPGGKPYDALDELCGVAGIALSFLTFSGDFDADWMRLHGLQPIR